MWEQGLPAKQAPRYLKDRIAFIAGKPCSHTNPFAIQTARSHRVPACDILPRLFSVAPACPACLKRCRPSTDAPKRPAPY